jgi:hypothetical protein
MHAAPVVVPGVGVGILAVLAFGTVHALLIVPIWTRLAGGVPFAVLSGLLLAWAFDRAAHPRGWSAVNHGLLFGVVMYATLLPATVVDAVMRMNGMRLGDSTVGMVAMIGLYVLGGSAAGWLLSRRRSTAIVFAMATLALMAVSGGPLPIVRSARAMWLSVGIGAICLASGAIIPPLRSWARTRTLVSKSD